MAALRGTVLRSGPRCEDQDVERGTATETQDESKQSGASTAAGHRGGLWLLERTRDMMSGTPDHRDRATIHTDDWASRGCAPASRSVPVPNIRVAHMARARLRATAAAMRGVVA